MEEMYFESLPGWHAWLQENHNSSKGIWLVFFKKESGKPSLQYEESVEEALCFGWIDSVIKKIDDERYMRKFSPRKDGSNWSDLNKKRGEKLIKEGRMTEFGMAKIELAKQNGDWDKPSQPRPQFVMHEIFQTALDHHPKAKEFFNSLNKADRQHYIYWVASAQREETREKRVSESLDLLGKGKKLGLK
jgi:uncharacterized protein YdeI (YjbR/CyaY-like superfamily)